MCLILLDSDVYHIPFIVLSNTNDVVTKELPLADNSASTDIEIPIGFAFGNTFQTSVYVRLSKVSCNWHKVTL